MLRFLSATLLPVEWMPRGQGLPMLLVQNLVAWSLAFLALLHGMALALRVRIRLVRAADGRRVWLAEPKSVRLVHMLLLGCVLIGLGATGGAMIRHRLLAEAERVFAATMAAASAGQPLPAGVGLVMSERRGDAYVHVTPEPGFVVTLDPRISGDHFLDRFVAPYAYGGIVRFDSGKRWEFEIFHSHEGWSIYLDRVR